MSEQPFSDRRTEMKDAVRDVVPVMIAVFPFGALFGALAVGQGIPAREVLLASATIFAGASQYAALDMLNQQVPFWAIVLAVFAINFRHVLYSATLGRHMGAFSGWQKAVGFFFLMDPLFAASETRRRRRALLPSYYFAYALILYANWMVANTVGVVFGALIENPADFGFDMILPIYFGGLVMGFHKAPNFWVVLAVSVVVSLGVWATLGPPWHITVGGFAGLLIAAALSSPYKGPTA